METNRFSNARPEHIGRTISALIAPFDMRYVLWRVMECNRDQTMGYVFPYADPRAYASRLNEVLGQSGWTVEYKTDIMPNLTRIVDGHAISTGKIITTATLRIFSIGSKSSQGEMWADDQNAVTRAEAQALKRAAAMFGIGKYFYDLKADPNVDLWVPIDTRRKALKTPRLPEWALLPHDRSNQRPPRQGQFQFRSHNIETEGTPKEGGAGTTKEMLRKKTHLKTLGDSLYASVVAEVERREVSGELKHNKKQYLETKLTLYETMLGQVRDAASDLSPGELDALLDSHQVVTLDTIPNYAILQCLADYLGVLKKAA